MPTDVVEDSAPSDDGLEVAEQPREPLSRRIFRAFVTLRWVPMTAALLALPLSATALFLSVQQPEVVLILPDQVRVVQGRESGHAYVYLQPAFVSTGRNDRVEVVRDMYLEFTAPGAAGEAVRFEWDQQLRLVSDPETGTLSYVYEADAVPLVIGPRDAATPLSLFQAPDGWHFAPGTYSVRLVADRVVTGQPLSDEFELTLSAENIAFLEQPGPEQFLPFRIN